MLATDVEFTLSLHGYKALARGDDSPTVRSEEEQELLVCLFVCLFAFVLTISSYGSAKWSFGSWKKNKVNI